MRERLMLLETCLLMIRTVLERRPPVLESAIGRGVFEELMH